MMRSKNMGKNMGWQALGYGFTLALCALGCATDGSVPRNHTPEADAGPDQELEYDGSPVEVTLDGSKSSDIDGKIVEYIWKSGQRGEGDAGTGLIGPDPKDERKPTIKLDQGVWVFVLWVKDDSGRISTPDTVTITVGEADGPTCDPDECPMPALGAKCCTTDETGAEPGDPLGRGPGLCGTDLGAVVPSLAGRCLQIEQPGEESDECEEVMGASLEPGCCTDEGMCGSVNVSAGLGCHYPQGGPTGSCTAP